MSSKNLLVDKDVTDIWINRSRNPMLNYSFSMSLSID